MTAEEELLKKRFAELARKSEGGYFTFTDFLGLSEQAIFNSSKNLFSGTPFTAFGGHESCERVMIRFGSEEELGYSEDFPIRIVKVTPKSEKYADRLTHRDFLGAILNLGIERRLIGDIPILDNVGYVFAKEDIADYIIENLERIKHTDVTLGITDSLPDGELFRTERVKIQISGERLDAVIAKVFKLSRDQAQRLFPKGLVFVSGRLCEATSYTPRPNEVISVRGFGRFIYRGYETISRKGKLNVDIDLFV